MRVLAFSYVVLILIFLAIIAALLQVGQRMETARAAELFRSQPSAVSAPAAQGVPGPEAHAPSAAEGILKHMREPLSILLVQVITIILASTLFGWVARRIGQPTVIGEVFAGILLGPSLFGLVWPEAFSFVFAPSSLGTLRLLSQIGVLLFLFVVGMDLEVEHVRSKAHAAVLVSHASILFPYTLGVALAIFMFHDWCPPGISFLAFGLFMGIAMSITAFPVLARILNERGLTRTQLGATAITCAAVDDVTAWGLLALVVAVAQAAGWVHGGITIALSAVYIIFMLRLVRRLIQGPIARRFIPAGRSPSLGVMAFVLVVMLGSAWITELIGIHALFGAFLAGVVMPADPELRRVLKERIETLGSVLLLPLFFAFTGLRTQLGLLNDPSSWALCALIIAVATVGKLGGTMAASRWVGMNWRDSFVLGALMNTRGLMELIALNVGYDLGILTPRVFTMMVLMALVTTTMTGPLVDIAEKLASRRARNLASSAA